MRDRVNCSRVENYGVMTAIPNATLSVASFITDHGTLDVPPDTAVTLHRGLTQEQGQVVVNGALNIPGWSLTIQQGTLGGTGTIVGPVTLNGGNLDSGVMSQLTIQGDYTQGAAPPSKQCSATRGRATRTSGCASPRYEVPLIRRYGPSHGSRVVLQKIFWLQLVVHSLCVYLNILGSRKFFATLPAGLRLECHAPGATGLSTGA